MRPARLARLLGTWTGPALLLALGLVMASALTAHGPAQRPDDDRPLVRAALGKRLHTEGHRYGPLRGQRLRAYWYASDRARPALAIVPGGYWSRTTDWSRWARHYAAEGYAVFTLSYRLDGDARWPAARRDVRRALRWIRSSSRYGVSPGRVLVLGSSAGGHLAAAAATYRSGRSLTAGVVALSPVASPYRAWRDGGRAGDSAAQVRLRENAERLVGCAPRRSDPRCWGAWRSASVKSAASGVDDAPMLLVHARSDWVSVRHSTDLAAAERAAGMSRRDMSVCVVRGAAHGMALLDDRHVRARVDTWLHHHGWD
ncbi:MAG: alpha/beta hydrolase [Kitasatospora sp.]|jgi:acetyl esterase/lipase|nr:alpha/beta hydrolase [Kitasatospora sp.]